MVKACRGKNRTWLRSCRLKARSGLIGQDGLNTVIMFEYRENFSCLTEGILYVLWNTEIRVVPRRNTFAPGLAKGGGFFIY